MTEYTDQQRLDQYQKAFEDRGQELLFAYMNMEIDEIIFEKTQRYKEAEKQVKELRTKLGIEEKLE